MSWLPLVMNDDCCSLSVEDNWMHFVWGNCNSWKLHVITNLISFLEVEKTRLLVSARWSYGACNSSTVQVVSSSVVASLLETRGFFDPWYHLWISVFQVFEGERVQKKLVHIKRIETNYSAMHFMSLQKHFAGLHEMLNTNISNIRYHIFIPITV